MGLAAWLASLVSAANVREGTIEKARTVVRSTWNLLTDPALVADKMSKAAAKLNGAKVKGKYPLIWDLSYAFQMVDDVAIDTLDLKAFMENYIIKIKSLTGWRADDLAGLYSEYSFKWHNPQDGSPPGVYIRYYDSKNKQKQWSQWLFVPCLLKKYHNLCLYRATQALVKRLETLEVKKRDFGKDGEFKGTPCLVWLKAGKHVLPLTADTIGHYYKRALLDQVESEVPEVSLGEGYSGHSARHAVASQLYELGLTPVAISAHTFNSPATLEEVYIRPIQRHWTIPEDCVKLQQWPVLKLLVPHVHWLATAGKDVPCDCIKLHGQAETPLQMDHVQDFNEGEGA